MISTFCGSVSTGQGRAEDGISYQSGETSSTEASTGADACRANFEIVPSGRPSLQESPWSAQQRPEGTRKRPRIGTAFSQRQFRLSPPMSAEPGALPSADTADATFVACWRVTFCRPHACAPRSCTCGWKRSRGPRPVDIREAERELAVGSRARAHLAPGFWCSCPRTRARAISEKAG